MDVGLVGKQTGIVLSDFKKRHSGEDPPAGGDDSRI